MDVLIAYMFMDVLSAYMKTGNLPYCYNEKEGDLVVQVEDGDYRPLPKTQRTDYIEHIIYKRSCSEAEPH